MTGGWLFSLTEYDWSIPKRFYFFLATVTSIFKLSQKTCIFLECFEDPPVTQTVKPCHLHTSRETMKCLSVGWVLKKTHKSFSEKRIKYLLDWF